MKRDLTCTYEALLAVPGVTLADVQALAIADAQARALEECAEDIDWNEGVDWTVDLYADKSENPTIPAPNG